MSAPDLSIVILSWNTRELTRKCLEALSRAERRYSKEIIVVDNASEDGSADMIASQFPAVVLVRNDTNELYAEGNNIGARVATGRFLCLLNSDTEPAPDSLDLLADYLIANPDYGGVAPKLVNPDGTTQRACARFPRFYTPLSQSTFFGRFPPLSWENRRSSYGDFDHETSRDVDQPPGSCFMVHREEFLAMRGLDPELALFFNDVDICKRLYDKGRPVRYLAESTVLHHGGASTSMLTRASPLWQTHRRAYYIKHFGNWIRPLLLAVECYSLVRGLSLRGMFHRTKKTRHSHDRVVA